VVKVIRWFTDDYQVMIRSWVWQDSVDVGVCWRFFKYQLVFEDSIARFQRDREFLLEYQRELEPKLSEENKNSTLNHPGTNELIQSIIGALKQITPEKGQAIKKEWNFPKQLNVKELIEKFNHIIEEMNSLKRSLDAIINMARSPLPSSPPSLRPSLTGRPTP
jgi:hypothetical protein